MLRDREQVCSWKAMQHDNVLRLSGYEFSILGASAFSSLIIDMALYFLFSNLHDVRPNLGRAQQPTNSIDVTRAYQWPKGAKEHST